MADATAQSVCAYAVKASCVVLQSIFLAEHKMLASMLWYCTSEGAFSALDGAVASVEWVWYGQECRKRHKKQLRRQVKKVSCTGFAATNQS